MGKELSRLASPRDSLATSPKQIVGTGAAQPRDLGTSDAAFFKQLARPLWPGPEKFNKQFVVMANPPFNLFDLLLVTVLVGGAVHGRKNGVSVEVLSMAKWLTLLLVCAAVYGPAGALISATGLFDVLTCYLFTYLGAALVIFLLFSVLERRMGPKLATGDIFGHSEYFLGIGSGMLRFGCMLMVGLALLNAREFTPAEVRALERYQEENYGSNIFPGLHSLQVAVFERSFIGGLIKDDLGFLLITPTVADEKQITAEARPDSARQSRHK
jgi:hypothetical protein